MLTEVLGWFASRGTVGRRTAALVVRTILGNSTTTVLSQTTADFHAALALYEARPDKAYSLTDCRSMLAMQDMGITEVLTNDHHFAQEAFTLVFP